jgi:hypothetical protein
MQNNTTSMDRPNSNSPHKNKSLGNFQSSSQDTPTLDKSKQLTKAVSTTIKKGPYFESSFKHLDQIQPEFEAIDLTSSGLTVEVIKKIQAIAEKQPIVLANGSCWVWLLTDKVVFQHPIDQIKQNSNHVNKMASVKSLLEHKLIDDVKIRTGQEHLFLCRGDQFCVAHMNATQTCAHIIPIWYDKTEETFANLTSSTDFDGVMVGGCWCGWFAWVRVWAFGRFGWGWYLQCANCGGFA